MLKLVVLCLAAVVVGLSVKTSKEASRPLDPNDDSVGHNLCRRNVSTQTELLKTIFVDARGVIRSTSGQNGTQIKVKATPRASQRGLNAAADVVARMTRYMPLSIFKQLAMLGSVGIFTTAEKLTIFPEYQDLANGNCGSSCNGSCSETCTIDGRKWEDIQGIGGSLAGILEDNLLCTAKDPFQKRLNGLCHELTHTIHFYAISNATKEQITTAYQKAKINKTWDVHSYTMIDETEYFADGSTAFFYVNRYNQVPGSMTFCGKKMCSSVRATRRHLRDKDPSLYKVLSFVFTDNRPYLTSGLKVCPPASFLK